MPGERRLERNCLRCDAAFWAQRVTARYCSNVCRQMAYFDRHEPPAGPDDGFAPPTEADLKRWFDFTDIAPEPQLTSAK